MVFAYSVEDKFKYIDIKRVDSVLRCPHGTSLRNDEGEFRYATAGEDIDTHVLVEPGLTEEDKVTLAFSRKMEKFADIVYGKVIAVIGDPATHSGVLGWPEVDVKKRQHFWIHKVPVGATLVPEE